MPERALRILQVNATSRGGGAAGVATGLRRGYARRGHRSWLAAGTADADDAGVVALPDDDRWPHRATGYVALQRVLRRHAAQAPGAGWGAASRALRRVVHPRSLIDLYRGREDFGFPATARLPARIPVAPDLLELHNLHGDYFDLRALTLLSRRVPTVLVLHDAWLLTGHCAHPFSCTRWTHGCGACPDLTTEPAIRRDATAGNWQRKRAIYARSRLHVVTPSRWLADMVRLSGVPCDDLRVIPNGVDAHHFRPGDRVTARRALGLPEDARIVVTLPGRHGNPWRDRETLRRALTQVGARVPGVLVVAVDADAWPQAPGGADVRHVDRQPDAASMARYFQAADVYLHSARADTFPAVVLEALACGTPVVATAVGGIPEQIRGVSSAAVRQSAAELADATGILVPGGDAAAMAEAVEALLTHEGAAQRLGANGSDDVTQRFTVEQQVDAYLAWYGSIMDHWHGAPHPL